MRPTIPLIQEIFDEYNQRIFKNELPVPVFAIGCAKSSLGSLSYKKTYTAQKHSYKITISCYYDFTRMELVNTIVHEMIHYYITFKNLNDTSTHGALFKKMMNDINQQFALGISISVKQAVKSKDPTNTKVRKNYILISEFDDGKIGISIVAQTQIFTIEALLKKYYRIKSFRWYGSFDPYFNIYPVVRSPKIYKPDNEDQLKKMLETSIELINDGKNIFPK